MIAKTQREDDGSPHTVERNRNQCRGFSKLLKRAQLSTLGCVAKGLKSVHQGDTDTSVPTAAPSTAAKLQNSPAGLSADG